MRSSLVVALPLAAAAASGCATYSIRRAALTPNPVPATRDGQPLPRAVEVGLGTGNLVSLNAPGPGKDPDQGIVVPRVDMNGAVRLRLADRVDVGFVLDVGLNDGAQMTAPDMPRPEGDTWGGGLTVHYSAGNGPLRLGIETDLLYYSVPWTESWTCVQNCEWADAQTAVYRGTSGVPVVAVGLVPSYRQGAWTFYGSATVRNHPTIDKGDVAAFEIRDPVSDGPLNLILGGGAEVEITSLVRLALSVYLPVTEDPASYGPTVASALAIDFDVPRR